MGLRGLLVALLGVQLAINVAYAGGRVQSEATPRLVNLDGEANLPSWWSSVLLVCVALIAAALAWADEDRRRRPLWVVAAIAFLLLSMDEIAGLHERLGEEVGNDDTGGRVWVLILGPVFLLAAVALVRLTRALSPTQRLLAVGGVALYALALLTEVVSVWSEGARGSVGVFVEENAEIFASNLIIVGLLGALLDRVSVSRLSLETPQ